MEINHILVDMDPTREAQPALDKAISLGKTFTASVELFLVDYHGGIVSNWFLDEAQLESAKVDYLKSKKRWLDTYLDDVKTQGLAITTDVKWHKPSYEGIIEKAKEVEANLVVKSTHSHPKINKLFFTPNDWQLLKACPVPLLLAKENSSTSYQNIMAAIDPLRSHNKPEGLNQQILKTTTELAQRLSAEAHVAYCFESIGRDYFMRFGISAHAPVSPFDDYSDYLDRLFQQNKQKFDQCLTDFQFEAQNQYLEVGSAHQTIPELVAKHDIDLLIVGTTYRTGLLGSTIEKMLDDLSCDVLAIKKEGFC